MSVETGSVNFHISSYDDMFHLILSLLTSDCSSTEPEQLKREQRNKLQSTGDVTFLSSLKTVFCIGERSLASTKKRNSFVVPQSLN